jgi:hypothetical protein
MAKKSLYSPPPHFGREESYEKILKERTGRTLDEWVAFVKKEGPPLEKERRAWLKDKHGLTTNYAWWVAECAEGKGRVEDYDPDAYVEAMLAPKPLLRPLFDALVRLGLQLGRDVKVCPCQTIVPFYRTHVFAQLKPSTKTRLDLGLALRDEPFTERLIDTGGRAKKDRITHRVAISRTEDLDDEVKAWLLLAYELDGAAKTQKS